MEHKTNWHQQSLEDAWQISQSSAKGLSAREVQTRLAKFGPNELKEKSGRGLN